MRRKIETTDIVFHAITILSLLVIGIIVTRLIRVQRGLLGFILAALTIVLVLYWMKELRGTVKEELLKVTRPSKAKRIYDIVNHGSEVEVVAEVPGPESEVKASLIDHNLEIKGGEGFRKLVKFLEEVEIAEATYRNGVLRVKLKKRADLKDRAGRAASSDASTSNL